MYIQKYIDMNKGACFKGRIAGLYTMFGSSMWVFNDGGENRVTFCRKSHR